MAELHGQPPVSIKKMDERELDPQVRDFVEKNLSTLIDRVIEDRRARGLCSLTIV